jgi:hypothetical protein
MRIMRTIVVKMMIVVITLHHHYHSSKEIPTETARQVLIYWRL